MKCRESNWLVQLGVRLRYFGLIGWTLNYYSREACSLTIQVSIYIISRLTTILNSIFHCFFREYISSTWIDRTSQSTVRQVCLDTILLPGDGRLGIPLFFHHFMLMLFCHETHNHKHCLIFIIITAILSSTTWCVAFLECCLFHRTIRVWKVGFAACLASLIT